VSNVGYANITMVISGEASKDQIVYVPATDSRQTVEFPKGLDIKKDEYGNNYIIVNGPYSYTFKIRVNGMRPIITRDQSFPISEKRLEEYLRDSNYVVVSDPDTQKWARSITSRSGSVLEAMTDLMLWVNSYATYDQNYGGSLLSSKEVLKTRKGWCGEFSNLYTAMARYLNIPTRITTGMIYTGSRWVRHGWAESYVNGAWVPVDGTYGEIGHINALHVKLYSAPTYLFYLLPDTVERITITDFEVAPYDPPIEVEANLSSEVVAPRSIFYLRMNVTNKGKSIFMPTYYAQKTVGIELVDEFRKSVILHPNETKQLEWKFIAPFGERDKYYVMLGGPGVEMKFPLIVDPNAKAELEEGFDISGVFNHIEGNELVIEFTVENTGNRNLRDVVVSVITDRLGTQQRTIELRVGEKKHMSFKYPVSEGVYSFEIRVEKDGKIKNSFGTAIVPKTEAKPEESLLNSIIKYLYLNAPTLFLIFVIGVAGVVLLILFVPTIEGPKTPFGEKEEWEKLLKLEKKKEERP